MARGRKNNLQSFKNLPDVTFDDLLQIVWSDAYFPRCPVCYDHFAYIIDRKKRWYVLDEKHGLPLMMFLDKKNACLVYEDGENMYEEVR